MLPVAGVDAAVGLPVQYGVELAISQNKDLGSGYTLKGDYRNYAGANGNDGNIAASMAQQLVADTNVIGIVGCFNSGMTKVTMPITNGAGVVSISPANTNPGLTKQQYSEANSINYAQLHPAGKPNAYFRIPGTDDVQGKVLAQLATQDLAAKSAFVADDNTVYGKGLADFFSSTFTSSGGTLKGDRQHLQADQTANFAALADSIKSLDPDVVFYGGVVSGGGGALKKALVSKGYTKPMVGGDGIADDPGFLETAGADAAVNTFGTVAAPDLSALSSAAATKFSTDYKAYVASKPNNTLIPYSAMSYDATMIIITAIKNLIKDNKAVTRDAVRQQVQAITYDGITGKISFDQNGDNSGPKVFSVYTVDSTKAWVYKKQLNG